MPICEPKHTIFDARTLTKNLHKMHRCVSKSSEEFGLAERISLPIAQFICMQKVSESSELQPQQ